MKEEMERKMLLLFNIFVMGSFWVMSANGASPEEINLQNAVASDGPATVVLKNDVYLTADLPYLAGVKVLTVKGKCGKSGKDKCVISGGNKYSLFRRVSTLEGRGAITLDNLIIKATVGGAVTSNGVLKVNNVNFVDNVYAFDLTNVTGTVTNSQFLRHSGGAVRMDGVDHAIYDDAPYTLVKFANCIFLGNRGGTLFVYNAAVSIDNCQFTQNVQKTRKQDIGYGGALQMFYGRATITNSLFLKNSADGGGGAIYAYGSTVKAINVKFQENVAKESGLGGGAVVVAGQEDEVGEGDGAFDIASRSRATFEKCSFVNNKARKVYGGAFSLFTFADIVFCKSTFSGNTGKDGAPSNGYVVDDGEGVDKSILTNPLTTIPDVTTPDPLTPFNVVYGKGSCN